MAKKAKTPPTPKDPMVITEQDIQKERARFYDFSACPPAVCPKPTQTFEVGEKVILGGLKNASVAEVLEGGKAYRLEYGETERETGFWWWYDLGKIDRVAKTGPMFAPHLPGQVLTTSLDSLLMKMDHGGLVCDPRYQRGYVWTLADQQSLVDSIFNRMNIGAFILTSHSGYLHKDDSQESRTYLNFDGDEVVVLKRHDYTDAVIDGQQRLTTIWRFVTNQFQYNGFYFDELDYRDRHDFKSASISYRSFREDDISYKDVLRMFIRVNAGVPQDPTHLEKVRKTLEALE